MMYADDELVMISALQHYAFCKRQCALIHLEQIWSENYLTAAGRILHEHVDEKGHETRRDVRTATAVRLLSHALGLTGVADMLEFHRADSECDAEGVRVATPIPGAKGFWRPFPVEYKHGKPKAHRADEVQLCAQAICLEEMLHVHIPAGALFYGKVRRRMDVMFDQSLRTVTEETATGVHQLLADGITPSADYMKACDACSLFDVCRPRIVHVKSARNWLEKTVEESTQ